ncbi:HAD-IC family P-type ATPase [Tistrella bauzanensis]|uniref:HAD-IC family P-type ATPase n=1 Tax=Tistrella arctica TaxID=3133430 RepID=A0ABU9YMP1_9PROT
MTDQRPAPTSPAAPQDAMTAWHAATADAALSALGTGPGGLSVAEAAIRLEAYGPNALDATRGRSLAARIAGQFRDVLIHVLLVAAAITLALGHIVDAAVILGVVLINAAIGFVQEGRAEKALAAIRDMIAPRAAVLRDGGRTTVDAAALVPGDIVLIEAGDRVPADLRLIEASGLHVDESALTGESVPVAKSTGPSPAEAALADRICMAYSGTMTTAGQARGLVVATGSATELGRIGRMIDAVETLETPLVRQMAAFGRRLSAMILALSAVVFAVAVGLRGYAFDEAFMAVVGLAVSAIPEGLPAVMTITLAIGVQRMARRSAIVRRLPAVETLGAIGVICSDKTGTLTANEMTVRDCVLPDMALAVTGNGYGPDGAITLAGADGEALPDRSDGADRFDGAEGLAATLPDSSASELAAIARAGLLCNDATLHVAPDGRWTVEGDPMEAALVRFAAKAGVDQDQARAAWPRIGLIPFDSRHRWMATLHACAGRPEAPALLCVKGAPEVLIAMCVADETDRLLWEDRIEALARRGRRVLAIAARPVADHRMPETARVADGLTLLGLIGMIDPPRPAAIAALAAARAAGISVKMITGDHAVTAEAIGRDMGMVGHHPAATGALLDAASPEEFTRLAHERHIFARVSPEHKLRLVEALQARGAVVAMTGDGVNDAPALKRADVGVAMGNKGTEAAKQAAQMVLADDDFASIVAAIREGRTVYDNLRKVIAWTLPTNGGEGMAIVAAILFGAVLPLTAVQILWINMITAVGLGLTLAFEPAEPAAMRRPPRNPDAPLITGFLLWRICFVSLLFVAGTFAVFQIGLARGHDIAGARTLVVNAVVAMEIFYLFAVRYMAGPSLTLRGILGTPAVLLGVGATLAAQALFTWWPPMNRLFTSVPMDLTDLGIATMAGVALFACVEVEKQITRLVRRRR